MTEIPEHIIKRSQDARNKRSAPDIVDPINITDIASEQSSAVIDLLSQGRQIPVFLGEEQIGIIIPTPQN